MKAILFMIFMFNLYATVQSQGPSLHNFVLLFVRDIIFLIPVDLSRFFTNLPVPVTDDQVTFKLYSRSNPNTPIQLYGNNTANINLKKPMKLLIHGWLENDRANYYERITRAYLKKGDYNVVHVDWSKPAGYSFLISASLTKRVGDIIAQSLLNIHQRLGLSPKNIHIVAHSLGSHVAGFVGKKIIELTNTKLARITALDAAGPPFEFFPPNWRIDSKDADIVDAIHTSIGEFGIRQAVGTVDFYPNGGLPLQPGCELFPELERNKSELVFCSHHRSYEFFIDSINSTTWTAVQCGSWSDFQNKKCNGNRRARFGENYTTGVYGNLYLTTNSQRPFERPDEDKHIT